MATTLRWIGGGDNQASDPYHWLPNQTPTSNDGLVAFADAAYPGPFIMNVSGNDLAGDTLGLVPLTNGFPLDFTANLAHQASMVASVSFVGTGNNATFNLAQHSTLMLGISRSIATVNIIGERRRRHNRI
jgi:hypothetical protein